MIKLGGVVGSNSLDVNGKISRCWQNSSPAEASAGQLFDLSSYMGIMVEVTGDLLSNDLYSASFDSKFSMPSGQLPKRGGRIQHSNHRGDYFIAGRGKFLLANQLCEQSFPRIIAMLNNKT